MPFRTSRHVDFAMVRWLMAVGVLLGSASLAGAGQPRMNLKVRGPHVYSSQELYCDAGYPPERCLDELPLLKDGLERYPVDRLGPWRWVLVHADNWSAIATQLGFDRESPAVTSLEDRLTFINQSLIAVNPRFHARLIQAFRMPVDRLLDFAIAHELGHALCGVEDESGAREMADRLRAGQVPACAIERSADADLANAVQGLRAGGQ